MRLAVLGVGLIGASAGMAARQRLGAEVSGFDPSPQALEVATERGAIDRACRSVAEAVADAELVLCAAPVLRLSTLVGEALDRAPEECVVSDVGSTKRTILAAHDDPRFVGGHPLAGAETAGAGHARADLFDGATWFLCSGASTTASSLERLSRVVDGLGARATRIEPTVHDQLLAAVSHVPHVLANVIAAEAAAALTAAGQPTAGAGASLRDLIRVAGAPSAVWSDIYLDNRDLIVDTIRSVIARLQAVAAELTAADAEAIRAWNEAAAGDRRGLLGGEAP